MLFLHGPAHLTDVPLENLFGSAEPPPHECRVIDPVAIFEKAADESTRPKAKRRRQAFVVTIFDRFFDDPTKEELDLDEDEELDGKIVWTSTSNEQGEEILDDYDDSGYSDNDLDEDEELDDDNPPHNVIPITKGRHLRLLRD